MRKCGATRSVHFGAAPTVKSPARRDESGAAKSVRHDATKRVRRGAALKFRRDVTLGVMCWESCAAGQESGTTLQNKALREKDSQARCDVESQARRDEEGQVRIKKQRCAARSVRRDEENQAQSDKGS